MTDEWGAWRSVVGWFSPSSEWYQYMHLGSGNAFGWGMLKVVGWSP